MKKSAQANLAEWALTCGVTSAVLPWLAFLVFAGVGNLSWFWLKCVSLITLGATSLWMLSRMKKGAFPYPALGWITSLVYFVALAGTVASAFPSTGVILVLAGPEIIGAILSVAGLAHLARVDTNRTQIDT